MKYIVTNFAYGTGPYLRTTELAIAFNDELEKRGMARMPVIIPHVYGEKQRAIMLEDFGVHAATHPGELLLDAKLGAFLKSIFYTGAKRYAETLALWVRDAGSVSQAIHQHLSGTVEVETLAGEKISVQGGDIALELNRSPRVRYDVAPSYSTTFGYIAEILERAQTVPPDVINIDRDLLQKGAALADSIEGRQTMNLMAYPATFSWRKDYAPRYTGEILVPPITDLPKVDDRPMDQGIFVTITGIEGLERLYEEARGLGLKLYSNDPNAVAGSVKALPSVIPNPAIKFQFARAGWGSLWLSMFCGTPILVPRFDPSDDPEVYFNNEALQGLGFGMVYKGQPLGDILASAPQLRGNSQAVCIDIRGRFGTLNGNEVCARLFADRFLK